MGEFILIMMDNQSTEVCFYSYNSRGIGANKVQFINDLLSLPSKPSVFCLQEHFLLRNNLYKLSKSFPDYAVIPKPAYKNFSSQNSGRPMGGLATIVPKDWRKYVTVLESLSWRLQPLKFKINEESVLLVNSYFPTDPKTITLENV